MRLMPSYDVRHHIAFSRREVELDHEKSKKGLAEVYEDEYLRQVKGVGTNQQNEVRFAL